MQSQPPKDEHKPEAHHDAKPEAHAPTSQQQQQQHKTVEQRLEALEALVARITALVGEPPPPPVPMPTSNPGG